MAKILICIALVFLAFVSTNGGGHGGSGEHGGPGNGGHGRPGSGGSGFGGSCGGPFGYGNNNYLASKLCANSTLAQSFLTQNQQLISNLQSNGSYNQVLQNQAQEIAYLQNNNNTDLLSSNCTAFFIGLKNAKNLDQQAAELQKQYKLTAARLFCNIIKSLI